MNVRVCKFCNDQLLPDMKGSSCTKCNDETIKRGLKNSEIFVFSIPILLLSLAVAYGLFAGIEAWPFTLLFGLVDASLIRHVVKIWRSSR